MAIRGWQENLTAHICNRSEAYDEGRSIAERGGRERQSGAYGGCAFEMVFYGNVAKAAPAACL